MGPMPPYIAAADVRAPIPLIPLEEGLEGTAQPPTCRTTHLCWYSSHSSSTGRRDRRYTGTCHSPHSRWGHCRENCRGIGHPTGWKPIFISQENRLIININTYFTKEMNNSCLNTIILWIYGRGMSENEHKSKNGKVVSCATGNRTTSANRRIPAAGWWQPVMRFTREHHALVGVGVWRLSELFACSMRRGRSVT